jgi:hypothetical protein
MPRLAVVLLGERDDDGEVLHQRRDDVGRRIADAVGGLHHLGRVAHEHQHRHEDGRHDGPLRGRAADEQVDERGDDHEAEQQRQPGEAGGLQPVGAVDGEDEAEVRPVEVGDELRGGEREHDVAAEHGHPLDDICATSRSDGSCPRRRRRRCPHEEQQHQQRDDAAEERPRSG